MFSALRRNPGDACVQCFQCRPGIKALPGQALTVKQGFAITITTIAQQADDAAGFAAFAHAFGQPQAGDQIGARRAAVALARQIFQQPRCAN